MATESMNNSYTNTIDERRTKKCNHPKATDFEQHAIHSLYCEHCKVVYGLYMQLDSKDLSGLTNWQGGNWAFVRVVFSCNYDWWQKLTEPTG